MLRLYSVYATLELDKRLLHSCGALWELCPPGATCLSFLICLERRIIISDRESDRGHNVRRCIQTEHTGTWTYTSMFGPTMHTMIRSATQESDFLIL